MSDMGRLVFFVFDLETTGFRESKRRFMQILSALHVCDLDSQPERDSEDFTPLYKVQEYFSVLFQQGRKLYAPGQQLSLEETLVRGVDIADQRRLHIQTRIHGLHRWWVRLFFYGFDVALCNAFRLFKLAVPETDRDAHITYRDFRLRLCKRWLGTPDPSVSATPSPADTAPPQHIPVALDASQLRCVVCAKWFDKRPLHSMGGKMEAQYDNSKV